jgi:hypothetical protein
MTLLSGLLLRFESDGSVQSTGFEVYWVGAYTRPLLTSR